MASCRFFIAVRLLSAWEPGFSTRQIFVWNPAQKVRYAVKLGAPLVVRHHDIPGCNLSISVGQHCIPGARVVVSAAMGPKVHRTELPDFATVMNSRQESARLLLLAHFDPILDQNNSRMN
jgi:hypothetical protein